MSLKNERFRELLARPGVTSVAPIYDPLSARIAEMTGWEVLKVSGSVGKFAHTIVPDGVPMTNFTDLAELCRRIDWATDLPLIIDADDGGSPLGLLRAIREWEAAGVTAIELEDNTVPTRFTNDRHSAMISKEEHVNKLRAAVAARKDPSTVIVGRTSALTQCPMDEALDRIAAYAKTGVDAMMFPGLGKHGLSPNPRQDIEAVQRIANLPLCVSGLPAELINDTQWMNTNRVKLRFNGQAPYRMAVKAIYDSLEGLKTGSAADFKDKWASDAVLADITRVAELRDWEATYDPAPKA